MRLKKLEINGFKSFADKVILELPDGITSIVGPNGSGKSNILDAVLWVLGEQSAKTLRGGKMEDVIFAGAETRKGSGFAEVSLTIDNSLKKMPIEFSEVTVTRRLFRSGESQFYINKALCRLKDIHQLFMDTGLGRDGYSIIAQGSINEIISSKPESRRNIFEEAAGIIKYKSRKEETEQKIQATQTNLIRVDDIISNLEEQIKPLEAQSKDAKKYLELQEEMKKIELQLYVSDVNKYNAQIEKYNSDNIRENDNLEKLLGSQKEINSEKQSNEENYEALIKNCDEYKNKKFEIESQIQKGLGEEELLNEKIANHQDTINRNENFVKESIQKCSELSDENSKINGEIELLNKNHQDSLNKLEEVSKEYNEADKFIKDMNKEISDNTSKLISLLNDISTKKADVNTMKALQQNITSSADRLNGEKLSYLKKQEDIKEKLSSLNTQKQEISKLIMELNEKGIANKKSHASNLSKREEFRRHYMNLQTELKGINSKIDILREMEREFEGYSKSVKNLLLRCETDKNLSQGVNGALAQLISVDKKYETAIETTLGQSIQNIVTETEEDAKKLIVYLKNNNLGRATFLPLSVIKGRTIDAATERKLKDSQGFISVASNLIRCDVKYKNIIENLLGRVIIADKMDNAIKIANMTGHSFKIVTLEGDVLNPGGSMTGGSNNLKHSGFLSRKRQIEELEVSGEEHKKHIANLNNEMTEIDAAIKKIENDIVTDNNLLQENKINENKLISAIEQHNKEHDDMDKRLKTIEIEFSQIEERMQLSKDNISKAENKLSELLAEQSEIEKIIEDTKAKESSQKHELEGKNKSINDLKIEIANERQKLIMLKDKLERNASEIKKLNFEVEQKGKENESIKLAIEELKNSDLKINEINSQLNNELSEIEKNINEKQNEINGYKLRQNGIQSQIDEINLKIEKSKEQLHRFENNITKLEAELSAIHNNVWEKYNLTFANVEEYKIEGEAKQLRTKLNGLKSEIGKFTNVNLGAIEEYERVSEKYNFLNAQKTDLLKSIDVLNGVIKDVVNTMTVQFKSKFEEINEIFKRIFKELFGGGKCSLVLTDADNVLESGVEIIAEPPGKKLQNINLLSGGEKALTAISLLFALFEVRPSPFCILDEIEAALDDANVNRFAEYLTRLSSDTQFMVITHRKGTMELSNNIYGISMPEKGISKVVSLKLDEI